VVAGEPTHQDLERQANAEADLAAICSGEWLECDDTFVLYLRKCLMIVTT